MPWEIRVSNSIKTSNIYEYLYIETYIAYLCLEINEEIIFIHNFSVCLDSDTHDKVRIKTRRKFSL